MDSLKNQAVTRNIDRYDYIEKIDQSKVNAGSTAKDEPEETKPATEETSGTSETSETSAADAA